MNLIDFSDSAWSVFPPLLAVILAISTRRVLLSLGVGILSGAYMLSDNSVLGGLHYLAEKLINLVWTGGQVNADNVNMIIFMLLLGSLISLMSISGATQAFANWAERKCATQRSAKSLTGLMVFIFFIDDFFHCLSVGAICRPITDRFKISRAKLAYLLDSTAAPMCVLMPISSWGAYIIALIGGVLTALSITDISPIGAFVSMVPMNLYAIFTLIMVVSVIAFKLDIGAMKKHEDMAMEGQLWDESKGRPKGLDVQVENAGNGGMIDMVLPILTLTSATVFFMVQSGAAYLSAHDMPFALIPALEHTNIGSSLVYGALSSLAVSIVLAMRLNLSTKNWLQALPKGVSAMLPAIIILFFAWTIGAVVRDMKTGMYLASLSEGNLPSALLPAAIFLLSCVMAFATGTSWGTFGIMLPLAGDIAAATDIAMLLPMMSAVLAGAVFGDHASPISSTSILSATGAGCHHIDHVMTQLPYAATVAFGALLGYLAIGFTHSAWMGFAVSSIWFATFCLFALRKQKSTSAEPVLS
ncbi:Na+/H+ antiporter NhaC family protein [Enterovibrio coralii]|uniref:Na+/H+ antiporter n=1 Tax=Enterovibrio coralii TaxID=294935 RepID=A0A135I5N9_9GAMM|nr:Na+/H+ antiporter NhaC family protein [Enterovibrio coralii]KXF80776.1 Na+/H+ antiporter [Enterovibrio coralii]